MDFFQHDADEDTNLSTSSQKKEASNPIAKALENHTPSRAILSTVGRGEFFLHEFQVDRHEAYQSQPTQYWGVLLRFC